MPQTGSLSTLPSLTGLRSITSPYSGKTYTYQWNDPTPPTDDDFNDIIAAHEKVPTADEQNIAAATKPEGKSHGAVADTLWNFGKTLGDYGSQLLSSTDLNQFAKGTSDLAEIRKDPEAYNRKFKEQTAQFNQSLEDLPSHPWEIAKAGANIIDPSGTIPGYMGIGESAYGHAKTGDIGGLGADVAVGIGVPWLLSKIGGPKGLPKVDEVTPPTPKQLYPETVDSGGPQAPRALLGPPREPIPPPTPNRFAGGPTGVTDLYDPNTSRILGQDIPTVERNVGIVDNPPLSRSFHETVGDPTKANAIPPIDTLPTVDTSIAGGVPEAGRVARPTIVPDVTPITERGLTTTGPVDTSLPAGDFRSTRQGPLVNRVPTIEGAQNLKNVGAATTIPRTGLWNRFLGDSGEYEVGKTVQELQRMKEEFLRKREEAKNLPPVEPIAGMGRTAPFEPKPEPVKSPEPPQTHEVQLLRQYNMPEETRPLGPTDVGKFIKGMELTGNTELDAKIIRMKEIADKPRMNNDLWQELRETGYKVVRDPNIQSGVRQAWSQTSSAPVGPPLGPRKLPEVDKPQSMSVSLPEREPVTPPDELTHPTAIKLAERVIKLDNQNVPDEAYGKLFTAKKALGPDETWRSRALDYIDHFESIARDNPEKFKGATVEPARGLPTVEPVSTQPTESAGLPEVEPIETPKVIGRGRKPLFAGQERVPRKEWPSLTEVDKPQEMKVREGGYSGTEDRPVGPVIINPQTGRPNIAMGGADPQVLRQLGTSLYTKDRPSILIQELMQNTVDEMKIAKVQKPVRVGFTEATKHPVTGQDSKSIIFQDFGRGMNESQLYNEFSDVGKSGKRHIQGAAGGFGFAKAAPFLGGDHMRVESVVNEGGNIVKYTFGGGPEEFLNQEVGVPLNSEVMPANTPTGMRVEVFFPRGKSFYNAKELLKTITEASPDIKDIQTYESNFEPDTALPTSTINKFTREGAAGLNQYQAGSIKTYQGKPLPSFKDTISTPENDADVYYDLDNKERQGTKLIFLNNGVFYHSETQGAGLYNIPHVPPRIVIDIKSKVAEGHDKYPFPANRQGLNEEIKSGYRNWVEDNVIKPARDLYSNELQTLYNNTKPKPGNNHVILDSGEKYTPAELTRVENSATLGRVARIMGTLLQDLESHFSPDELVGYTDKHGYRIADPGSGGMNISDPSTNSPNLKTLVTINPFDALYTGFQSRATYSYAPKELQPAEASRRFVHLIKHEFAHNLARNEGAGFTWAFSQVDTRFPKTTHYESQVFKALTDRSGNYDPEVSQLLQEYIDSRGRSATKEDVLSRQGAGISDEGGRKPEGISRSDKSDGEGITPVEPVGSTGPVKAKPKIIKTLREGVASKEQIENELATGDLPQVEPVKNWGGTPETISIEGKGKKLSGKRNKFEYPSESDIPDLPSAPVKPPLAERFGAEPTSSTTKPSFESGKGYIDPNKVDVVYPGREFIKGKGNVDRIMEERAAEKTAESTPSFQDPGGFKANYASPHKTLSANPLTEPIARNIVQAYDKKIQWIRAKLESAAPFISKLGKSDRGLLGKALDTGDFSNLTPELTAKAKGLKNILDQIHTEFPENKNVGYIKNYFTHIADEPKEGMARSIINLFKDNEVKTGKGVGNIGDFYEQGLGTPDSPYIKKRTGALKNINYDVKTVLPQYLDSIAKVIFDQPAVEKAKTYLKHVPEGSKLKDLASWYIKNYTRYDSEAALHKAFTSPVSKIANATARSFIDFNPGLHALHLGELPVNIWPELGSKYTKHGIKEVTLNPLRTWTETSKLGLIQGETKPFAFKTAGERWQSLAYFLNLTEKFVKGVGYEGAKKMYLDQGFSPAEASRKAVELTKDMTLDTGPARQIKGLSNESNTAGGEVSSRLGGQFKGIPIKIAEQMYNVAKNARANPKAALRMAAGAAAMIYATKKGAHLFHLDPASLARTTALGAFGTAAADFTSALYRGDYETAVENAVSWAIPGGQSAKKIYNTVTDKESRTKKLAAQREKEGKAWGGPPVNTLKRAVDYMFKGS